MTEGRNIAILAAALLQGCKIDRSELGTTEINHLVVDALNTATDSIELYNELEREMELAND